jgi:hypothetical protein
MLRKGQEGHVRAERDVLKSAALASSPGSADWIVRMHYSFQDRDHLYLVCSFRCNVGFQRKAAAWWWWSALTEPFLSTTYRFLNTWAEAIYSTS